MERFGQVNFGALSQVLGMDPNVLMQICQNSVRQPAPIAAAPVVQVVEEAVQENSDEDDYYSSEEEPAVNVFGPIRLAEIFVTLIDSQKNNKKAEYDGFLFVKQKLSKPNGAKQFWSCDKHKSSDGGCRARLHTLVEGDQEISSII
uniref:FLYWCH-type domain-containing protein n=1 Tax=Ditylenchus dipsaci TaxID=166011 RepID=A0A915CZL5_9BILA